MGMLLHYHRIGAEQVTQPKRARKPRARRGRKTEAPEGTALDGSHYADLTDEQVAEAYAATIPDGEATERDAQVVELRAVNAHRDTFDADPEGSDGE